MLTIIGKILRHSPLLPQTLLAQYIFNHLFKDELSNHELDFMKNRWLKLVIKELNLSLAFGLNHGAKLQIDYQREGDACINISLRAAREIITGKTDPDALFFQRELNISGDTDLAHHIKNMLDNKIWPQIPALLRQSLQQLQQVLPRSFNPNVYGNVLPRSTNPTLKNTLTK
jgi:O2-independent ubiquinone biosynthesis accessory factor UbiT